MVTVLPIIYTHFNPLPPCGGRHSCYSSYRYSENISIHSLRVEGDDEKSRKLIRMTLFQSTPSVWRETLLSSPTRSKPSCISIHSLRVEGDETMQYFVDNLLIFQSTPSVWRETHLFTDFIIIVGISIHSLRVEGDRPQ